MKINDINWAEVPDILTKEQVRLICHCSKRTALYYLKSGKLPCVYSGKKTRCYKIRKEDLMAFIEDREKSPEFYAVPDGWYGSMIAEGGAMGEPGAIKFVKTDGNLYHLNYVFGNFKIEEILAVFPTLGECDFGFFGMDSKVPKGWNYVNLGMGNYLIVKTEVYPPFKKLISKCKSAGEIYQSWINHADYIINSKGDIKMKNNVTELVFILDRSGSMAGLEADTIGGFNSMIDKQKKLDGKVMVSTVLFDNDTEVLHDRIDIQNIEPNRVFSEVYPKARDAQNAFS